MKPKNELRNDNLSSSAKLLEFALEKSKSAVSMDCGNGDKVSLNMYKEAIEALQKVIDDDLDQSNNKSRLKSIQESYLKRIEFLSKTTATTTPLSTVNNTTNKKTTASNSNNKKRATSTTRKTKNSSSLNVVTTTTTMPPPVSKTAAIMLSSVFSLNKRLSNKNPRPTEEVKQPKPSFFEIKPSTSTPIGTNTIKRKNNNNSNNNDGKKNRYSWNFTASQVFSSTKHLAVEEPPLPTTDTAASSPTLPSFEDFSATSSPVKQDYFDLNSVTNEEGTCMLFEEQGNDEKTELQEIDDVNVISNKLRHSTDSECTLSSRTTTALVAITTTTPPMQVLLLDASDSDLTVHEGSNLSTSSEANHEQKEYELVTLEEEEETITVSSNTIDLEASLSTTTTYPLHRSTSIITNNTSMMHPMERTISNSTGIELLHPIENSVSTSNFQKTVLGRKKSSKKLSKNESTGEENNLKTTFVSYLQTTTTKYNKKVAPSSNNNTVDLGRSRSKRKWSISTHVGKIPQLSSSSFLDPVTFLAEPAITTAMPSKKEDDDADDDISHHHLVKSDTLASLTLMNAILESMMHGGYITSNLHIPMDLWYQSNVRLPATDAKIAACELLLVVLEKMDKRKNFGDCSAIENDLKVLEQTLCQIKYTLIKKLGYLSSGENDLLFDNGTPSSTSPRRSFIGGSSAIKTSQTIAAWSTKLSKSVERMKLEATRSIPNTDQNDVYIKTLIRLFTAAKVLEKWNIKITSIIETESCQKPLLYKRALSTNERCISLLKINIGGFVLKDYQILLDKWLKRSMDWTMD